ncbi:uncharacterized protein EV422DRAFT_519477, partial [Fimicolochytrium jonesii]|uniref:uncharacterized protein n=1 Tax=Fimicolochytrium jonesii TaxID=1396493 RepID=UPI0022FF1B55
MSRSASGYGGRAGMILFLSVRVSEPFSTIGVWRTPESAAFAKSLRKRLGAYPRGQCARCLCSYLHVRPSVFTLQSGGTDLRLCNCFSSSTLPRSAGGLRSASCRFSGFGCPFSLLWLFESQRCSTTKPTPCRRSFNHSLNVKL